MSRHLELSTTATGAHMEQYVDGFHIELDSASPLSEMESKLSPLCAVSEKQELDELKVKWVEPQERQSAYCTVSTMPSKACRFSHLSVPGGFDLPSLSKDNNNVGFTVGTRRLTAVAPLHDLTSTMIHASDSGPMKNPKLTRCPDESVRIPNPLRLNSSGFGVPRRHATTFDNTLRVSRDLRKQLYPVSSSSTTTCISSVPRNVRALHPPSSGVSVPRGSFHREQRATKVENLQLSPNRANCSPYVCTSSSIATHSPETGCCSSVPASTSFPIMPISSCFVHKRDSVINEELLESESSGLARASPSWVNNDALPKDCEKERLSYGIMQHILSPESPKMNECERYPVQNETWASSWPDSCYGNDISTTLSSRPGWKLPSLEHDPRTGRSIPSSDHSLTSTGVLTDTSTLCYKTSLIHKPVPLRPVAGTYPPLYESRDPIDYYYQATQGSSDSAYSYFGIPNGSDHQKGSRYRQGLPHNESCSHTYSADSGLLERVFLSQGEEGGCTISERMLTSQRHSRTLSGPRLSGCMSSEIYKQPPPYSRPRELLRLEGQCQQFYNRQPLGFYCLKNQDSSKSGRHKIRDSVDPLCSTSNACNLRIDYRLGVSGYEIIPATYAQPHTTSSHNSPTDRAFISYSSPNTDTNRGVVHPPGFQPRDQSDPHGKDPSYFTRGMSSSLQGTDASTQVLSRERLTSSGGLYKTLSCNLSRTVGASIQPNTLLRESSNRSETKQSGSHNYTCVSQPALLGLGPTGHHENESTLRISNIAFVQTLGPYDLGTPRQRNETEQSLKKSSVLATAGRVTLDNDKVFQSSRSGKFTDKKMKTLNPKQRLSSRRAKEASIADDPTDLSSVFSKTRRKRLDFEPSETPAKNIPTAPSHSRAGLPTTHSSYSARQGAILVNEKREGRLLDDCSQDKWHTSGGIYDNYYGSTPFDKEAFLGTAQNVSIHENRVRSPRRFPVESPHERILSTRGRDRVQAAGQAQQARNEIVNKCKQGDFVLAPLDAGEVEVDGTHRGEYHVSNQLTLHRDPHNINEELCFSEKSGATHEDRVRSVGVDNGATGVGQTGATSHAYPKTTVKVSSSPPTSSSSLSLSPSSSWDKRVRISKVFSLSTPIVKFNEEKEELPLKENADISLESTVPNECCRINDKMPENTRDCHETWDQGKHCRAKARKNEEEWSKCGSVTTGSSNKPERFLQKAAIVKGSHRQSTDDDRGDNTHVIKEINEVSTHHNVNSKGDKNDLDGKKTKASVDSRGKHDEVAKANSVVHTLGRKEARASEDAIDPGRSPPTSLLRDPPTNPPGNNNYQCGDCNARCFSLSALLQHQRSGCLTDLDKQSKQHAINCDARWTDGYGNEFPELCECSSCPRCSRMFKNKYRVFTHCLRGCYGEMAISMENSTKSNDCGVISTLPVSHGSSAHHTTVEGYELSLSSPEAQRNVMTARAPTREDDPQSPVKPITLTSTPDQGGCKSVWQKSPQQAKDVTRDRPRNTISTLSKDIAQTLDRLIISSRSLIKVGAKSTHKKWSIFTSGTRNQERGSKSKINSKLRGLLSVSVSNFESQYQDYITRECSTVTESLSHQHTVTDTTREDRSAILSEPASYHPEEPQHIPLTLKRLHSPDLELEKEEEELDVTEPKRPCTVGGGPAQVKAALEQTETESDQSDTLHEVERESEEWEPSCRANLRCERSAGHTRQQKESASNQLTKHVTDCSFNAGSNKWEAYSTLSSGVDDDIWEPFSTLESGLDAGSHCTEERSCIHEMTTKICLTTTEKPRSKCDQASSPSSSILTITNAGQQLELPLKSAVVYGGSRRCEPGADFAETIMYVLDANNRPVMLVDKETSPPLP